MDSKISSLAAETAPASADLGVIVDDVAGTPNTKKATLANIVTKGHGLSDGLVKVTSGTMAQAVEDTDYQGVLAEGAFDDGDKTKLDTVATGATANTGALADLDTVDTPQIDDDAVTYAKMQNVTATDRLLGRDTAGAGVVEELTPAAVRTMLNVEDGADVTDTANVTAAGALMDSEVTNLADVKSFDPADYATAAQGTKADNALPKAGGTMTGAIEPADHGTATDPEVVAVVYGTSATPPTASTTPEGCLYIQYSA